MKLNCMYINDCDTCFKFNDFSKLWWQIDLEIQLILLFALLFLMYIYICFVSVWLWNTCGRWFVSVVSVLSATENQHFDALFLFCFNLHVRSCLTTPLGTEAVPSAKTCICYSQSKNRPLVTQFHCTIVLYQIYSDYVCLSW